MNLNKKKGYVVLVFALAYFVFTTYIAGHGIHFLNVTITLGLLGWAYILLKKS